MPLIHESSSEADFVSSQARGAGAGFSAGAAAGGLEYESPSKARREKRRARRRLAKDIARVGVLAAFFVGMAWLLKQPWVRREVFDIDHIRMRLRGHGAGGALAFVGVAGLAHACGVPRLWVSAASGILFGMAEGTLVGLAASVLGSAVDFYLARGVLRGVVLRRMPARMKPWYDRLNRNGFRWLLYFRFFPLSNATMTSLLGGVSKIRLGPFLAATAIGYTPLTIACATLGSSAAKASWAQLGIGLGLFCLILGGQWAWARRSAREDEAGATQAAA